MPHKHLRSLSLSILLLATPAVATAMPLDLTQLDTPNILAGFIEVTYDGLGSLDALGFALELDPGTGPVPIFDFGDFFLSAQVDSFGNLLSGDFSVTGTVVSLGFTSGLLLEGSLTDMGFPVVPGADTLEFLADVTSGDAAGLFGPVVGVILSNSGYAGAWDQPFDNGFGFTSEATIAPIPEPGAGTLTLFAVGALVVAAARRRA